MNAYIYIQRVYGGSTVAAKKQMRDILLEDLTNDPEAGYNESVNAIINFITDIPDASMSENAFVKDCRKVIKGKCK